MTASMQGRRHRRLALSLACLLALPFAAIACGDDDDASDEPLATVTETSAATNTAPAATPTRTPTEEPEETATATSTTAAPSDPGGTDDLTDIDGVNAIVAAVEDGNTSLLASYASFLELECTNQQGGGGPPKCAVGEAEGTPVRVFPVRTCEGEFIRDRDLVAFLDVMLLSQSPALFAVVTMTAESPSEMFPGGDYGVVFSAESGGRLLGVNDSGQLVTVLTNCQATPQQLVDSQPGAEVLYSAN